MATYVWDKNQPSGSSQARHGPALFRSDKSTLQAALEQEHYFTDGSANSSGEHKLGSARIWSGASSAVSASGRSGGLMWDETNSQLVAIHAASVTRLPTLSANTFTGAQSVTALSVGTYEVITSARTLQNVSIDGSLVTGSVTLGPTASTSTFTTGYISASTVSASYISTDLLSVSTFAGSINKLIGAGTFGWTVGEVGNLSLVSTTVGVTGAALADSVVVSASTLDILGIVRGFVSAPDVVCLNFLNASGDTVDLTNSIEMHALVIGHS